MAADLPNYYSDLAELSKAAPEELQKIEGVGPNTSQAIVDWFARPANVQLLHKLMIAGVWPKAEGRRARSDGGPLPFEGLTFVITGVLPTFSRDEAREFIQQYGGKVTILSAKRPAIWCLEKTLVRRKRKPGHWAC